MAVIIENTCGQLLDQLAENIFLDGARLTDEAYNLQRT